MQLARRRVILVALCGLCDWLERLERHHRPTDRYNPALGVDKTEGVQAVVRTGTLGPVRKTLALAEPLSDEQLELLELEPGVSASEVEAESRIFIPYIRFSDGT
jgi:hypothetical protein